MITQHVGLGLARPASNVQAGLVGSLQVALAASTCATKPFIFPAATSATALASPCGPPPFMSITSWNGLSHVWCRGSGAHTVGTPSLMGIPAAPG